MAKRTNNQLQWSLERDGVTQGMIGRFLECRAHCRLANVELWTPYAPHAAFIYGDACHTYIERYCKAIRDGAHTAPDPDDTIEEFRDTWLSRHKRTTGREIQTLTDMLELAAIVLPRYVDAWWKADKRRVWLEVEGKFKVEYKYKDGLKVPLVGRRDGAYHLPQKKKHITLVERKSGTVIDPETVAKTIELNTQCMTYLYAFAAQYGTHPHEIMYDFIRRPALRQGVKEQRKVFLNRVEKDVAKDAAKYFPRFEAKVTEKTLWAWKTAFLDPVMVMIREWSEAGCPAVLNPAALVTKYGRSAYFDAIVDGDYSRLYRRGVVFAELESA